MITRNPIYDDNVLTLSSSTAIDHLRADCENKTAQAIAYFYFDFNDREKQQVTNLLRSVIAQLCRSQRTLPSSLHALYEKPSGMWQPSSQELMKLFPSVLGDLDVAYVIIDALDECAERMTY